MRKFTVSRIIWKAIIYDNVLIEHHHIMIIIVCAYFFFYDWKACVEHTGVYNKCEYTFVVNRGKSIRLYLSLSFSFSLSLSRSPKSQSVRRTSNLFIHFLALIKVAYNWNQLLNEEEHIFSRFFNPYTSDTLLFVLSNFIIRCEFQSSRATCTCNQ